jgi:hypothetical protein
MILITVSGAHSNAQCSANKAASARFILNTRNLCMRKIIKHALKTLILSHILPLFLYASLHSGSVLIKRESFILLFFLLFAAAEVRLAAKKMRAMRLLKISESTVDGARTAAAKKV